MHDFLKTSKKQPEGAGIKEETEVNKMMMRNQKVNKMMMKKMTKYGTTTN